MKKVKVVLHVMAGNGINDAQYGEDGVVCHELQKKSEIEINFVSFCGTYLKGNDLQNFLEECKDAQVVIVDAWNHPTNYSDFLGEDDPLESMASVIRQVLRVNPVARIFADLMEGVREVAVHKMAEPINSWVDDKIVQAIKASVPKEGQPTVLVFDDTEKHRQAARDQLSAFNLFVVESYDRAESLLQKMQFDYVLLDLLVPASEKTLGPKGRQFAGQEMPLTPLLAFLALQNGVKKVGILTDANHHDHPASAAVDVFRGVFSLGDAKVEISNSGMLSGGIKDWAGLMKSLD